MIRYNREKNEVHDLSRISVLMSVYREKEEYLRMAIESILNQTYSDLEFIIVNDDPENEEMSRILHEYAERDPRIVLVQNEHNMGLDRSLNHGLRYVTSEYVARMDSNDFSHPDRLEKEHEYITSNNYDIVSCFINTMDEAGIITEFAKPFKYNQRFLLNTLSHFDCVAYAAWMVRRDVYIKLNGYRHIHAAEDYDYIIRSLEHGYKIGILDESLFDCRKLSDGISGTYKMEQFLTTAFFTKHMKNLSSFSEEYISDYVKKRITERSRAGFTKCKGAYRKAVKASILSKPFYIIQALFSSRYSLALLKRIMLERKFKRSVLKLKMQQSAE